MKVIIVEVTRAANSFGQTHLAKIREAYELIAGIVERAQADGAFKDDVTPQFAAMAFYGAIEQVLTGWIFELLPRGDAEYEQAKELVVETICGGLDRRSGDRREIGCRADGQRASSSASSGPACSPGSARSPRSRPRSVAAMIWRRAFGEDPPE